MSTMTGLRRGGRPPREGAVPVKVSGRLMVRAIHTFSNPDQAQAWLRSPNKLLHGETPLQAMKSPRGAMMVERQLDWFAGQDGSRRLHTSSAPTESDARGD